VCGVCACGVCVCGVYVCGVCACGVCVWCVCVLFICVVRACGVCVCMPLSTFKKSGMNFIPLNLPQPYTFKFRTTFNDMEDAQTEMVGKTTAPSSIWSRYYVR
jgi:hypothetical protein